MKLTLETARTMIAECRRIAAQRAFKPITVIVLDGGGDLIAAEREDRSPNKQFHIAHGKAHGAISVGIGSRGLIAHAAADPNFFGGIALALGSPLLAAPGGVLVRDADGELLGAIGVSGESGDNDELLAVAAIAAVGLTAQVE
jgi:uncharacterized protein GlcG (DUF336 family)